MKTKNTTSKKEESTQPEAVNTSVSLQIKRHMKTKNNTSKHTKQTAKSKTNISCTFPLHTMTFLDVRNHDWVLLIRKGEGSNVIQDAINKIKTRQNAAASGKQKAALEQ